MKKIIIMGAAGRDFHNFNTVYRTNGDCKVVAFTATQIPEISDRKYPPALSGELYPEGVPIHDEKDLLKLIKELEADEVVFAYSDVAHEYVMHKAAMVNAAGADFKMIGTRDTMIKSSKPVIAVCAVRTGSGKSQTSRAVVQALLDAGKKVATIRHPMPYGDLVKQAVQRFASYDDLVKHECTIEEREEYEPYIDMGAVIFSGVDYERILREAEKEADVIVWDGGNNDTPFYAPNLHITIVDPHRSGHEVTYYPGETNLRMADVVLINKVDTADYEDIAIVEDSIREVNADAQVIYGASPLTVDDPASIRGKKVVVVEDGPTLTHGEMSYGAGTVAADRYGAGEIIDPRPFCTGSLLAAYDKYPQLGDLIPALGYYEEQLKELEQAINTSGADVVVSGTPIDLNKIIKVNIPMIRVRYSLQEIGQPTVVSVLKDFKII